MASLAEGKRVLRKLLRWWWEPSLMDQLIQAEIDGPPAKEEDPVLEARIRAAGCVPSRVTAEEVRQGRRIRAMVTYGTPDADPEEIALLTNEECERLEAMAIQHRWERFWIEQGMESPHLL